MAEAPFFRDDGRPFPQRYESMSLDIVRANDIPKGKTMYVKEESLSLKTDDLYKARPHYNHLQYLNKPDLSVGSTDPEHAGGRARTYYAAMDRRPRDLSLTTADIDHAQPKASSWKGNRHVDPVNPVYELPSCIKREPTPPRWNGRHTNDVTDIEHSRSKVLHPQRNYSRDPNDSRDIEYSSANRQERHQRYTGQESRQDRLLDVRDINGATRRSQRSTNPLEPNYKVSTAKTTSLHARYSEEREALHSEPEVHGEVHGSKPRKLHWDNGEPQLSLLREDIPGAAPQRWVGSVPQNIYDPPEVRAQLSFHDPGDIPGAQVGSLRKGIQTKRQVNPLNPRYGMLDGDQMPRNVPTFEGQTGSASQLQQQQTLMRSQGRAASTPELRSHASAMGVPGAGMQRDHSEAGFSVGSQRTNPSLGGGRSQQGGLSHPGSAHPGSHRGGLSHGGLSHGALSQSGLSQGGHSQPPSQAGSQYGHQLGSQPGYYQQPGSQHGYNQQPGSQHGHQQTWSGGSRTPQSQTPSSGSGRMLTQLGPGGTRQSQLDLSTLRRSPC